MEGVFDKAVCAKNSMFNVAGVSPHRFVFGRSRRIPADSLQEEENVAASEATLRRQAEVRTAARQAVVASQDCKALRAALRARPRVTQEFVCGQWVAYWSPKLGTWSRLPVRKDQSPCTRRVKISWE